MQRHTYEGVALCKAGYPLNKCIWIILSCKSDELNVWNTDSTCKKFASFAFRSHVLKNRVLLKVYLLKSNLLKKHINLFHTLSTFQNLLIRSHKYWDVLSTLMFCVIIFLRSSVNRKYLLFNTNTKYIYFILSRSIPLYRWARDNSMVLKKTQHILDK